MANKLKKSIDIKTKFGTYHSQVREFNDERHFDNWARVFEQNTGSKIIGSKTI
jgi:hypothetical protein